MNAELSDAHIRACELIRASFLL